MASGNDDNFWLSDFKVYNTPDGKKLYRIRSLEDSGGNKAAQKGWKTERDCGYPQILLVVLHPCDIRFKLCELRLTIHQRKVPCQIDIYASDCSDWRKHNAYFEICSLKIKQPTKEAHRTKIVTFEGVNCRYLKIAVQRPLPSPSNAHNQSAIARLQIGAVPMAETSESMQDLVKSTDALALSSGRSPMIHAVQRSVTPTLSVQTSIESVNVPSSHRSIHGGSGSGQQSPLHSPSAARLDRRLERNTQTQLAIVDECLEAINQLTHVSDNYFKSMDLDQIADSLIEQLNIFAVSLEFAADDAEFDKRKLIHNINLLHVISKTTQKLQAIARELAKLTDLTAKLSGADAINNVRKVEKYYRQVVVPIEADLMVSLKSPS